jgi:glyceraldehyde 3-phosphate dehydrogenase
MTVRVAINGFGRTGRCTLRSAHLRGTDIDVVAINDVMDIGTLAHLLRHDSVFGRFPAEIATGDASTLTVDGREISVFRESDPARLPKPLIATRTVIAISLRATHLTHVRVGRRCKSSAAGRSAP